MGLIIGYNFSTEILPLQGRIFLQQYLPQKIIEGLNSWLGHIGFGQSKRLKAQTFSYLVERGVKLYQRPGGSWGLLEQQSK